VKQRLVLFLLLVSAVATAQQPFRGTITYKVDSRKTTIEGEGAEKEETSTAIAQFGVQRIRFTMKEPDRNYNEVLLILLDSGKVYALDEKAKTYTRRRLGEVFQPAAVSATPRTILGYSTKPVIDKSNNVGGFTGVLMAMTDKVFYVSDSLFYPVPAKYTFNPELLMVQNNHIVLGGLIEMRNRYWGMQSYAEEDDSLAMQKDSIFIEAIAVDPAPLNEALFEVPASYENEFAKYRILQESLSDTSVSVTTTVITEDSIVRAAPVKTPQKPQPKKPVSKTTKPVKPAAVRPKQ
jgi:hypothetical protein